MDEPLNKNRNMEIARTAKEEGFWRADIEMWKNARIERIRLRPETLGEDYLEYITQNQSYEFGKQYSYVLITLGFPENAVKEWGIDILDKVVRNCLSKVWIKGYVYNWEFYHKDGTWSHPHVHIFCTRSGKKKSEIIRECYNTCKEFLHAEAVDVKLIQVKDFQKTYNYVNKNRIEDVAERFKLKINNLKYESNLIKPTVPVGTNKSKGSAHRKKSKDF